MKNIIPFLALILFVAACDRPDATSAFDATVAVSEIHEVMFRQQDAWNAGDIDGFMVDYWNSDSLTFASSGVVRNGWQETIDRYKTAYPDRAAMGTLTFTLFDTRVFTATEAFVFGRFELERENDRPSGFFTVLFRKIEGEWKVVFDHTSSDPSPPVTAET